ncbi:MAG: DUF58 domain-containing protein [Bacteroidales bacterium]|nr:DUF58 domain-containing protein [Bacteroidales bacterium]
MEYSELIKKVHKIEIKAKGLSRNVFAGQYKSAFKGRGMTFSEVREYTYGDEVRSIDWNVTARYNKPFVKVFEEERELALMLMIDVSGSTGFGSRTCLKTETITEIAAILAFSAISNNDKVGALLFSDKVEMYIPPKKGSAHCLRIIRELLSFKPKDSLTSFSEPFVYVNNVIKRHCTCFLITDGLSEFDKSLSIFARKHDVCSILVNDKAEYDLLDLGLTIMEDFETKEKIWVDTSDKQTRQNFAHYMQQQQKKTTDEFKKLGIDYVNILTDDDYTKALIKLFANRERL